MADFLRFYGVSPKEIMDMGYQEFWMLLVGLGEGSRWVMEANKVMRGSRPTADSGTHKVAETNEELRHQWDEVARVLNSRSG